MQQYCEKAISLNTITHWLLSCRDKRKHKHTQLRTQPKESLHVTEQKPNADTCRDTQTQVRSKCALTKYYCCKHNRQQKHTLPQKVTRAPANKINAKYLLITTDHKKHALQQKITQVNACRTHANCTSNTTSHSATTIH